MKNLTKFLLLIFLLSPIFISAANLSNLNGLTTATQFLKPTTTDANLSISITSSSPSTHFFQPNWSGVLSVSRGGTGTSTAGTGQLLMGNGTGYTFGDLIAGLNIVITKAIGSITIAVTSTPAFTNMTLTNPLSPSSGGTGTSTAPSDGQLLIGGGGSYRLSTLTAGPGIAVTNGSGTISIAASAPTYCDAKETYINLSATEPTIQSIVFDATSTALCDFPSSCSSVTSPHTITGLANRILFVYTWLNNSQTVTNVSYASSSMSQIATVAGGNGTQYLFYLTNPPSGTHNIVANFSGSATNTRVYGASYSGTTQIAPEAFATANNSPSDTVLNITTSTVSDGDWMVMGLVNDQGNGFSAGTGTRKLSTIPAIDSGMADSGGALTPPGSHTLEVTRPSGTNFFGGILAAFAPANQPGVSLVHNLHIFNTTSTLQSVMALNAASTGTVAFNMYYGVDYSAATSSMFGVFSSNQTITATTTPTVLTSFASSTPGKNNVLKLAISNASSSGFYIQTCYQ